VESAGERLAWRRHGQPIADYANELFRAAGVI
jgi:hypothetical protein